MPVFKFWLRLQESTPILGDPDTCRSLPKTSSFSGLKG